MPRGTLVGKTGRFGRSSGVALSGVRLHQEGPAAAGPAAVRGHLPQEQGRPPRPASRRRTGNVFWGCSKYPKRRLTRPTRAARWRARRRRRAAGAQGRGGDLPCGSTSDTAPDDIARRALYRRDRRIRTHWHGRPVAADERALAAPVAVLVGRGAERADRPARAADRTGRGGVSAVAGELRPTRRSSGSFARLAAATPRRTRSVPTLRRRLARLAGEASIGDALRGPTCAYLTPGKLGRPIDRGPAARRDPVLPSLGGARGSPRVTRAIATPRLPGWLARPRGRSGRPPAGGRRRRVDRGRDREAGPDPGWPRPAGPRPGRDRVRGRPAHQRARRGRRRLTRPAPRRDQGSARAARNGSGCWGGRPSRRWPRTWTTAGRSSWTAPAPNRARSSSTTSARRSAFAACAASTGCAPRRPARRRVAPPSASFATHLLDGGADLRVVRNCSATRTSRRPRSIRTSRPAGWRRPYRDAHRARRQDGA